MSSVAGYSSADDLLALIKTAGSPDAGKRIQDLRDATSKFEEKAKEAQVLIARSQHKEKEVAELEKTFRNKQSDSEKSFQVAFQNIAAQEKTLADKTEVLEKRLREVAEREADLAKKEKDHHAEVQKLNRARAELAEASSALGKERQAFDKKRRALEQAMAG